MNYYYKTVNSTSCIVYMTCKQWTLASRFVVCLQLIKGLDNGNEMDNNGKKGTKLNNE